MGRINLLSKETAQLIAAGEVVERPASVVKELLENSIDSGASNITVEIKDGGVSYIRVTDNGCGMDSEDIERAFLRHATSKIENAADLEAINTLGFRGEALASIASVAKVEAFTREKSAVAGTFIKIEGSVIVEKKETGCPTGTTISVRNLFYNTPARLKFLKKDKSEAATISGVIEKIALSNPAVSIKFINDGKEQLFTPGDGKLSGAIYSVLGKQLADTLIEVDYNYNNISIKGYISKPVFSRGNRKGQYFFINGRIAGSRIMTAALEEGYRDCIMTGKYPVCVLNISINPCDIDVNVHPTKAEVKFSNDKIVFDAIYFAVKDTLEKDDGRQKLIDPKRYDDKEIKSSLLGFTNREAEQITFKGKSNEISQEETIDTPNTNYKYDHLKIELPSENFNQPMISEGLEYKIGKADYIPAFKVLTEDIKPKQINDDIKDSTNYEVLTEDFKILGEAFDTYIIVQFKDEVCFIDKHAAHERIIYKELKAADSKNSRQQLLIPSVLQLQKDEVQIIRNNINIIDEYGFTIEDFGAGSIIVREIPTILANEDPFSIITSIASDLLEAKGRINTDTQDKILHTIACKAAIKAGRSNDIKELEALVKMLLKYPDIKYCPHGRPIMFTITRNVLEKQFKRIV